MNLRLLPLAVGVAVGYVLGTRDGRERYEAMKSKVNELWESPQVVKARADVENYAKTQAPIIRDRAEAMAKAAPGVIADGAKITVDAAREAADRTAEVAKDAATRVSATAKDVAEKVATTAKDVADKTSAAAKDVADKVSGSTRNSGQSNGQSSIPTTDSPSI